MLNVKKAIFAKLNGDVGDGSLTAIMGADRVSQGRLPSETTLPWLTFLEVVGTPDAELPSWVETYQISAWSRSRAMNAAISARVRALLHKQPLITDAGRTWFCVFDNERELTEPTGIYQRPMDFRIGSFV
jgi:hypothetical protein